MNVVATPSYSLSKVTTFEYFHHPHQCIPVQCPYSNICLYKLSPFHSVVCFVCPLNYEPSRYYPSTWFWYLRDYIAYLWLPFGNFSCPPIVIPFVPMRCPATSILTLLHIRQGPLPSLFLKFMRYFLSHRRTTYY